MIADEINVTSTTNPDRLDDECDDETLLFGKKCNNLDQICTGALLPKLLPWGGMLSHMVQFGSVTSID